MATRGRASIDEGEGRIEGRRQAESAEHDAHLPCLCLMLPSVLCPLVQILVPRMIPSARKAA
jgi:hypothetical protein